MRFVAALLMWVLTTAALAVAVPAASVNFASPKSSTFTWSFAVNAMFAGFKSR